MFLLPDDYNINMNFSASASPVLQVWFLHNLLLQKRLWVPGKWLVLSNHDSLISSLCLQVCAGALDESCRKFDFKEGTPCTCAPGLRKDFSHQYTWEMDHYVVLDVCLYTATVSQFVDQKTGWRLRQLAPTTQVLPSGPWQNNKFSITWTTTQRECSKVKWR